MSEREPIWRRYLRLVRPDPVADADEELRLHLDLLEADARARGLSSTEVREDVLRRFGDPEAARAVLRQRARQRVRRARTSEWLDGVRQDLRYAVRKLHQQPGFTAAVVGILALGIGATTAIFSAVDAAMLRPLPFPQADRLVVLRSIFVPFQYRGEMHRDPSNPDIMDAREMSHAFRDVAAYAVGGLNLVEADRPVRVRAGVVTSNFFRTIGIATARGRPFEAAEGVPGGPPVTVLSWGLWQRHFGGQDVIGRTVSLNGRDFTIIGIMPQGFSFPEESDLWIPYTVPATFETFAAFRGTLPSVVVARLAGDVTVAGATQQLLDRWERGLTGAGAEVRADLEAEVAELRARGAAIPLQSRLVGSRRTALLILLGATGLLLLIACVNVTNLLLARATSRRREMAMRAVLGATRGRVLRQLLTESVLLSLAGAAAGVALAPVVLDVVQRLLPDALGGVAAPQLDWRVLGFTAAVAALTGLGFGLWPALGVTRTDPIETIKGGGGHGATAGGTGRARRVLVAAEVALAVMLLVGAGLMLRSFQALVNTETGMETEHVGTLELAFGSGTQTRAARLRVIESILGRLDAAPGVTAAGVINDLPLRGGGFSLRVEPVGGDPALGERYYARYLTASAGFFEALGIPLLRGRLHQPTDDSLAPPTLVISERLAREAWPGRDPVGQSITLGGPPNPTTYQVIGVVRDVRETGLEMEALPLMYLSPWATPPVSFAVVARGTLPATTLLGLLREAVRVADPAQAVFDVRTMDEVVSQHTAPRRTNTLLIGAFGGLALLLAVVGVYAVVTSGISQRTRELGIRTALGATGVALIRLIAREMIVVVALGLATGLAGAWALARVIASLLYGVVPHDPFTFVAAPAALLFAALLATLLPARRVLRLRPMDVMRVE